MNITILGNKINKADIFYLYKKDSNLAFRNRTALSKEIKIIECPRDAMQGIKTLIPTKNKVSYIQSLLRVGFDTIDFGSFVSPKAIPQMQDTAEVLAQLDLSQTTSKLLAIIANTQGAEIASEHKEIQYLGFPFSISENFQMRNTHKTIAESIITLQEILEIADKKNKEVITYLSMGFGNPYGDPWNVEIVGEWTERLSKMGVKTLSLSDTVGSSTPDIITYLFSNLIAQYPQIEFGAHLHTTPNTWFEKIDAAFLAGCRRFDGAIQGFGGCPMATDKLTGNMPTEKMVSYFTAQKQDTNVRAMSFESAYNEASKLFGAYH
jgi:hydroxymethylglutaryl-CoA lyase